MLEMTRLLRLKSSNIRTMDRAIFIGGLNFLILNVAIRYLAIPKKKGSDPSVEDLLYMIDE